MAPINMIDHNDAVHNSSDNNNSVSRMIRPSLRGCTSLSYSDRWSSDTDNNNYLINNTTKAKISNSFRVNCQPPSRRPHLPLIKNQTPQQQLKEEGPESSHHDDNVSCCSSSSSDDSDSSCSNSINNSNNSNSNLESSLSSIPGSYCLALNTNDNNNEQLSFDEVGNGSASSTTVEFAFSFNEDDDDNDDDGNHKIDVLSKSEEQCDDEVKINDVIVVVTVDDRDDCSNITTPTTAFSPSCEEKEEESTIHYTNDDSTHAYEEDKEKEEQNEVRQECNDDDESTTIFTLHSNTSNRSVMENNMQPNHEKALHTNTTTIDSPVAVVNTTQKPSILKSISSITYNDNYVQLDSTTNINNTKTTKKSVTFGTVQWRMHSYVIGDNPSCCYGTPVQLSWTYHAEYVLPVLKFEKKRYQQRQQYYRNGNYNPKYFCLSANRRKEILINAGYTTLEIKQASKNVKQTQRKRTVTSTIMPIYRVQEAFSAFNSSSNKQHQRKRRQQRVLQSS